MADEKPTKRNHRFKDLTGQHFGKLTVLGEGPYLESSKKVTWTCRCDCGNECNAIGNNLVRGKQISCGCERSRINREMKTKHGMASSVNSKGEQTKPPSSAYLSWQHAKGRCTNPNKIEFPEYGGRGITMCEEWLNSFAAFYAHIGPKPPNTSLDRIDNSKGYEPGNVRWATATEQANNRRHRRWKAKPSDQ